MRFPHHTKEIFQYMYGVMDKQDLEELQRGSIFDEVLINCYFKILQKVNLVMLASHSYH